MGTVQNPMTIMKKILVIAALVVTAAGLKADDSHFFQASLTPDIALQPKTAEISGISLDLWGENPQHCFALGFVNGSSGDSGGFTWSFIANYSDSYTGVAWSFVNISKTKFVGWQAGMVNYAQEFHGLQWGFVNYAVELHGVQIGLANIAINNPWFNEFPDKLATGFPIVNWSF
jgi:hypothetical protein